MSTFLLGLVTFSAFSAAAATANQRSRVPLGPFASPGGWECVLALVVVLAVACARHTSAHGWLPTSVSLVVATVSGFLSRMISIRTIPRSISSISGDFTILASSRKEASGWRGWWEVWKGFLQRVGDYQSHLLLTLFYFIIIAPVAVWVSATKDPLRLHTLESGWQPRPQREGSLHDARRQF